MRRAHTRRILFAVLGLAAAAHVVQAGLGLGGAGTEAFFSKGVATVVEVAGTLLCLWRAAVEPRERAAWAVIGLGLGLWVTGDLIWLLWLNAVEDPAYPSVADAAYLASYAALYAGIVLLYRSRLRPFRAELWLDGLLGGMTVAAVGAALVFQPVLDATAGDAATVAVTLAYPLGDLLLLCFITLGFALNGWRADRTWVLLGAGQLTTAVADSVFVYQETNGVYATGGVLDALWPIAVLLSAGAAWQSARAEPVDEMALRRLALPFAFAIAAVGLLMYGQFADLNWLAAGLCAGALLLAAARAWMAFMQNVRLLRLHRDESLLDGLSGLPNRRALMADLDVAFAGVSSGAWRTLVFFDLDGFKDYNDTFGHAAGDALLSRLGFRLAEAVAGNGRAYRLGGDEFCTLLDGRLEREDPLVRRAAEALAEHGDRFAVVPSFGHVLVPDDAPDPTQALQTADTRMYAHKHRGRASSRRQTRDVLLAVLGEREPGLHEHTTDVADLATRLGRSIGLAPEELDVVQRAAELHDIGKMAVPDAILHKPGPLDPAEWRLILEHTVVGERIIAAAPALRPVAALVRASHERWDGGGYPDGLAGGDIPLGARIVAVCDAFAAMVSDRPYHARRTSEAALTELERCAGTQFDPAIVDAFAGVVVARAVESPSAAPS